MNIRRIAILCQKRLRALRDAAVNPDHPSLYGLRYTRSAISLFASSSPTNRIAFGSNFSFLPVRIAALAICSRQHDRKLTSSFPPGFTRVFTDSSNFTSFGGGGTAESRFSMYLAASPKPRRSCLEIFALEPSSHGASSGAGLPHSLLVRISFVPSA